MTDRAILIVDDNPHNLQSFQEVLRSLGRKIILCESGQEALTIASNQPIAVLLMDVQMPEMNGFEVADLLKARKATQDIPILFISAACNNDDFVNRGYASGAVDYLAKPIDPSLLLNKIQIFLQISDQRKEIDELLEGLKAKNAELLATQEKLIKSEKLIQASKLSSLGTMAAGMCHELNNPLSIIMGNAEILSKSYGLNEAERERLQHITHSSERMRKIVDHLRAFARESKEDDRKNIDVVSVIKNSFNILNAHLTACDISHEIVADCDRLIFGDSVKLESIFQNLISNSRDAFAAVSDGRSKQIRFDVRSLENGTIKITYEDNAGGIPSDVIDHIFEPFFTTKDSGVGTGLGLSISYGIIKDHRGTVAVSSTEGEGTRFEIVFPSFSESAPAGVTKALIASAPRAIRRPRGPVLRPRVLVVDDEPQICDLIRDFVQDEFDVEICSQPSDSMAMIEGSRYDVILTDLKMPQVTGYEVIAKVQTCQPETPVIIMSGHARNDQDVAVALKQGARELLLKPFYDEEELKKLLFRVVT